MITALFIPAVSEMKGITTPTTEQYNPNTLTYSPAHRPEGLGLSNGMIGMCLQGVFLTLVDCFQVVAPTRKPAVSKLCSLRSEQK